MKKLAIAVSGILLSTSLLAEEVLYCTSELETGFYIESGKWFASTFAPERFPVKVNDNFNSVIIGKRKYACRTPFLTIDPDYVVCDMVSGFSFRYSKKSNRFVWIVSGSSGYILSETKSDTDSMYVGKCEKF